MKHNKRNMPAKSGGKGKKRGALRYSDFAAKAISQLRSLKPSAARFSLSISIEGRKDPIEVIKNGRGPDSSYWIRLSRSAKVPGWMPAASTYLARTPQEFDSIIAMFADQPSLWSACRSDAADLPNERYEDDPSWGEDLY